jgi:ABC-2 type transport system permease protein
VSTAATAGPATAGQASPCRVLAGLAVRQVRSGALIITAICAGMSALVVAMYENQALDPAALEALARNPAIRTLFGEPVALDDPGGFTVWRTGATLAVLLAVWSSLAATRITRGEEDAGRWHLLLSGRTTLPGAVHSHLGVLAVVPIIAGAATATAMITAGAGVRGSLLHGAGLAAVGFFFVALGGLTAQLFGRRSAANGAAAAIVVVGLLTRMVGDGVTALAWLRWTSPFGLVALTRPFDTDHGLPLAVLVFAAVMLLTLTARLAARRDLGASIMAASGGRPARTRLLGSVTAFAIRRTLRPLAGWAAGVAAYFLLIGLVARSMSDFLMANPQFTQMAAQAGFSLGTIEGYAATLFALLAIPVGAFVAARLAALAADEGSRRLALLLAAPVTRTKLLAAEAATATGAALILTTVAGIALWAGSATVGAGLDLGDALAGALNVVPIVLLCLGAAVLALGWAPRGVAAIGALPAAGGFLWQVIADSIQAPTWVSAMSPFAHLAAVPATAPHWPAAFVMTALGAVGVTAGMIGYRHRDLHA